MEGDGKRAPAGALSRSGARESSVSGLRIAACRVDAPASASARSARGLAVGIGLDDRNAHVAGLAQGPVERDRAEQRHVELGGERRAAALAERVRRSCSRPRRAASDRLRAIIAARAAASWASGLRRRHDEHLRARQQLAERDRHVAGPRGKSITTVSRLAPVDVGEELLEPPVEHRAAPHHGRVLVEEVSDRDQLQVAADGRHDHLVDHDRPLVDAEQVRDRVAVDVRVDDADLLAEAVQRGGQVDRQRRLADAPLPLATAITRVAGSARSTSPGGRRGASSSAPPSRRAHHVEAELDAPHARQAADVLGDLVLEGAPQGSPRPSARS